jgi:hypothetical protein
MNPRGILMGFITSQIFGLPFRNPKNFDHFYITPIANHMLYYREESGVSPQRFGLCESCEFGFFMILTSLGSILC